ncbi:MULTISPECIES: CoA transferase [Pseudonocardia]|uniref:Succinyl-CoA:(R)-benzylsuccinate CoA-transferase subunit BbsF n=2 Tax=Pseudonocardia TaxID=1847 RepID=A0A1Y2MPA6_PSEAH|nr:MULTISPECIES: CoA transferase [Pseudonocardia]OSY37070.1 Succinyl-CoA:(R)-benzylsuccinate CoA-transferase subunit BbsF [Pseudonocardia autotrophica]TDN72043.1 CoA transferase family III [Pseudonocardia autotrophica]BBG02738.1 CoA transferase [Pseudonocardia autotrophica]GEC25929.1 CoA transferase [Pseudonocardia saturnea]
MDAADAWLASGVVPLTGHPDGPALVPPGRAAAVAAELGRLFGTDGAALLAERAALTGRRRAGRISVGGGSRLLRLRTGWAAVGCARPDDPALLGALVGRELPAADPWPELARALAGLTPAELDDGAALLGLAAHSVPDAVEPAPAVPVPGPARDVAGATVVSFGALWAAPLCTHLLGLAGARVVTVETPSRPDRSRHGTPGFHDLLHAGDRSVVLDPGDPDQRAALHRLVRRADIVVEASRPRALRGFGIDAGAEVARGATWISITAAGRDSDRVGFGDDVAASAGLVARDHEGLPVFAGDAIADPLTGLTAAALALCEPGVLHDVSMTGVVAATLDGSPGGPSGDRAVAEPRARTAPGRAPAFGADTTAVITAVTAERAAPR